jgi:hypothetical protein
MPLIEYVDVDEAFVGELWEKVSECASFYSIGDGFSREHFHKVFFESDIVAKLEGGFARAEIYDDFVELHVLVFGPSFFRNANEALNRFYDDNRKLFKDREIRCIIPSRMKGFRMLAKYAGMAFDAQCSRLLSGIPILCDRYIWRPENV